MRERRRDVNQSLHVHPLEGGCVHPVKWIGDEGWTPGPSVAGEEDYRAPQPQRLTPTRTQVIPGHPFRLSPLHLLVICLSSVRGGASLRGVICAECDPGDRQPPGSGHPLAEANIFIPAQR